MKINVNVMWDCRELMACSGRADRICSSIVIYSNLGKLCKCSSSSVAIHNEIYFTMEKPFGKEPGGCCSALDANILLPFSKLFVVLGSGSVREAALPSWQRISEGYAGITQISGRDTQVILYVALY